MTVSLKSKDGQAIRKLIPLTTLSESAFTSLCAKLKIEEVPKGTILFKQGDKQNEFVYVLDGTISLQAAGMEMDTISGGSEESRFALAHQIPRKVFAVAKDKVRFVRVNANLLKSTSANQDDSVGYEVSDIPDEASGDWMTTLLKSPIFQRLPASNLQKVLTSMEEVEVKTGELIVRQGEPGDYYYIIKKGRCSLTRKPSQNAREIKLAELKTTETFGEDSLISGAPRNVNITMLTDGVLLRLSKSNFLDLVKKPVIQAISFDQAIQEVENGALFLDVRTPDSFEQAHIPNSRNVPFFSLRMQISSLNPKTKVIVVCEDGNTSEAACFLLIRHSMNAVALQGGFQNIPQHSFDSSDSNGASEKNARLREANLGAPNIDNSDNAQSLKSTSENAAVGQALQDPALKNQIEKLSHELAGAKMRAEQYQVQLQSAEKKLANITEEAKNQSAQILSRFDSLQTEYDRQKLDLKKALDQNASDQKRIESLRKTLDDQEAKICENDGISNQRIAALEEQLKKSRQTEALLEKQKNQLAVSHSAELQTLSEKKASYEYELSELRQELEQAVDAKRSVESELELRTENLQSKLNESSQKIADTEHRLESALASLQERESRVQSLQENLDQLAASLSSEKENHQSKSEQLNESLGFLDNIKNENESLNSKLLDQTQKNEALTKEIQELKLDIQAKTLDYEESSNKISERFQSLENENNELHRKLDEADHNEKILDEKVTLLESQKHDLTQHAESEQQTLKQQCAAVTEQNAKLQSANFELEGSLTDANSRIQNLQAEIEQSNQASEKLQRNLDQLTAELEKSALESEDKQNRLLSTISDLHQSLQESTNQLENAQSTGQQSEAKQDSLITEIKQLRDHNEALESKIADLSNQLTRKNQELGELEDQFRRTAEEIEKSQSDQDQASHELGRLKQRLAEIESANTALKQELESSQQISPMLSDMEQRSAQQQEQIQGMSQQHAQEMDEARRRQQLMEDEIAALNAENAKIQERLIGKGQELSEMELKISSVRKENTDLHAQFANLKDPSPKAEDLEKKTSELNARINQLNQNYQAALHDKDKVVEELKTLRQKFMELESRSKNSISPMDHQATAERVKALKAELESVRTQGHQDLEKIKIQLSESQKEIDRLEQELKTERERVAELQESGRPTLTIDSTLTAVDEDLFGSLEGNRNSTADSNQSNKAKSGIGKLFGGRLGKP